MSRSVLHRVAVFLALAAGPIVSVVPVSADDPLYGIEPTVSSGEVVISTYSSSDKDGGTALVAALVQTGPYNRGNPAFTNETISQGYSKDLQTAEVFSVSTFQSPEVADTASRARKAALPAILSGDPVSIKATVVEHLLANWGWERGGEVTFTRVVPGKPTRIYDEYNTTLAFFKSGYTGQMSMLEFFQPGATLEAVRGELTARRGMSGASIYREKATGNYIAYSEYFDTASALASKSASLVVERRMGQVQQNYSAR